jgi:hypothetical protein
MGSATPPVTSPNGPDHVSPLPTTNGFGQGISVKYNERPTILHLGDPIHYNPKIHDRLKAQFHIIHVADKADLERSAFINHLKARTWGDFSAIMRPFWRSGNEMQPWNRELIELLPKSVKVMASAGAGFDWVNDRCLAENGRHSSLKPLHGADGSFQELYTATAPMHLTSLSQIWPSIISSPSSGT